ncbi:MAG: hypothetical protein JNM63_07645 [Spirochaetia bacterium]|nr:hypothetical protein [Spirochaetia bacterium]
MKVFHKLHELIFDLTIIGYCLFVNRILLGGEPLTKTLPPFTVYLLFLYLVPYLFIYINTVGEEMAKRFPPGVQVAMQVYHGAMAMVLIFILVGGEDIFGKKSKNDPTGGFILVGILLILVGIFCRWILKKSGFWQDVSDFVFHWVKETFHLLSPFLIATFFIFFDEVAGLAIQAFMKSGKWSFSLVALMVFFFGGYVPFRILMFLRPPFSILSLLTGITATFFFIRYLVLMARGGS